MKPETDFRNFEEGCHIDKRVLEQYAQCVRENEDLINRIRLIDIEISKLESENGIASADPKYGKQSGNGKGRSEKSYREKKAALLQLRTSYENLQARLSSMATDVEQYIQSIDDSRMRQIMRLRYVDTRRGKQMTWCEIAHRLGETEDSCRKAHDRWLGQGL